MAIGMLRANGCRVDLSSNEGLTLSNDISTVADATTLDFSSLELRGVCCA